MVPVFNCRKHQKEERFSFQYLQPPSVDQPILYNTYVLRLSSTVVVLVLDRLEKVHVEDLRDKGDS